MLHRFWRCSRLHQRGGRLNGSHPALFGRERLQSLPQAILDNRPLYLILGIRVCVRHQSLHSFSPARLWCPKAADVSVSESATVRGTRFWIFAKEIFDWGFRKVQRPACYVAYLLRRCLAAFRPLAGQRLGCGGVYGAQCARPK